LDWHIIVGGLIVGLLVGLTGVGGSSLMLPILVLFFRVPALIAVGTDLAYSVPTKILGAIIHRRQETVNPRLVLLLCLGGIPGAIAGVLSLSFVKSHVSMDELNTILKHIVGVLLLVIAATIFLVQFFPRKDTEQPVWLRPKAPLIMLIGGLVGFAVSITSIGAGSITLTLLALILPRMRLQLLVGSDVAFAAFIVPIAAAGHLTLGSINLPLTLNLLLGSLPGVFIGSRLCGILPTKYLRPAMAGVMALAASRLF